MIATNAQIDVMMTSKVIRTLITRKESTRDSRANSITLTAAGLKITTQAIPLVEGTDNAFFAKLGPNRDLFLENLQLLARLHKTRLAKKP